MSLFRRYISMILALLACSAQALAQHQVESAIQPAVQKFVIHQPELLEPRAGSMMRFIVGLQASGSDVDPLAEALREDHEIVVYETWTRALTGLLVECDLATAEKLASDPRVAFVEQDIPIDFPGTVVETGQAVRYKDWSTAGSGPPDCYDAAASPLVLNPYPSSMPTIAWGRNCPGDDSCIGNWGLDRIDDRQGLDGSFQPMAGTHPVDVFIIDTSVNLNHHEFDTTPVEEILISGSGFQPHAHGSHVAGILVGKNYGVASDYVRFHSVTVGGPGQLTFTTVINGFEAVLAEQVVGVPAVVSLSANSPGLPSSPSMASAVQRVIAAGITVVNSAGNIAEPLTCDDADDEAQRAENVTLAGPAYPPKVLIVGASDDKDRAFCECDSPGAISADCGSRLGAPGAIDLFAPGVDIVSMTAEGAQSICRLSGTSMAAPHVAGAAALLLSRFPGASPGAIHKALRRMATQTIVKDHNGLLVTNGRLLYIGADYTSDTPVAGYRYYQSAHPGDTLTFPKRQLVGGSFDWQDRALQVTSVSGPVNGQLIDRGAYIEFTVDADAPLSIDDYSSAAFLFTISNGIATDSARVRIKVVDEPPVASFTYTGANLEWTFDGSSSSDDREIVEYRWFFSDGVEKTGPVVNHFFHGYPSNFFRTFSVSLRVTDTYGSTTTKSLTFTVVPPILTPQQGLWSNPRRSGNGFSFYVNSFDQYTLTWYTYLRDGTPIWYISGTAVKANASWSQPLYRTTWNGSSATITLVGQVTVEWDDSQDCWFSWTLNGQAGGERFRFLHGGDGASGLWFPPSESGWGLTVSASRPGHAMVNTVTFYEGSQPRWVQGQVPYSPNAYVPVSWYSGPGLCPSCKGSTAPTPRSAGSIRVEIPSGSSATGFLSTAIQTPSGGTWTRSRMPIQILTVP